MTLAGIAKRLDDISAQLGSVQSETTSLSGQVKSLDGKLTALDHKMTVEFEDTKRLINLGFESTQMLREEVARRFDEAEHANAGHRSVLEAAIVGLGRDIKR